MPNRKTQSNSKVDILIKTANDCYNPLKEINVKELKIDNQQINLYFYISSELTTDQFDLLLQLTEYNMKELYEQSEWGWHRGAKLKEFQHKSAKFIILRNEDKLVAFCHFRFAYGSDNSEACVYCYELQVVEEYQRKGVGKYLMEILVMLAYHFQINKVMLTVFKHNVNAMEFYMNTLNFKIDKSSPSKFNEETCYEILSLKMSKLRSKK